MISPRRKYKAVASSPDDSMESFKDIFEQSGLADKKEGTVVNGVITAIEGKDAIIDIGMKVEGKVPVSEFTLGKESDTPAVKVGDVVKVFLEKMEGAGGYAALSYEWVLREEMWDKLESIIKEDGVIEGVIFGRVKCGFTVDIGGVVAFLPGSQVDVKMVKDITPLMGIKQPFKILKIHKKQGNIVVSRRAIMEYARADLRSKLLSCIEEGSIVEGTVKNITDYGAFIDLGGIDGLLHVTDLSWRRVNHPSEILSIGQTVKTKVIKFNKEIQRISLGMKQIEDNPWVGMSTRYPVGSRHYGVITNVTDYGAFVEIEEGIEGLVYVSEISWVKFNTNPRELLHKGQKVQVEVLGIDETKNRISLSIKRCQENPWIKFAKNHSCGDIVEGHVLHIVDFGVFIGFEGEVVDGLAHVHDLSWSDSPDKELFKYKKGDKVQVKILSIEAEKERISVGVKQIEDDPMENAMKELQIGQEVLCSAIGIKDGDLEVCISRGATGIIDKSEFAVKHDDDEIVVPGQEEDAANGEGAAEYKYPAIGSSVRAKVLEIVPTKRLIKLSTLEVQKEGMGIDIEKSSN